MVLVSPVCHKHSVYLTILNYSREYSVMHLLVWTKVKVRQSFIQEYYTRNTCEGTLYCDHFNLTLNLHMHIRLPKELFTDTISLNLKY